MGRIWVHVGVDDDAEVDGDSDFGMDVENTACGNSVARTY